MTVRRTPGGELSELEITVLRFASEGRTFAAIARILDVTEASVLGARQRALAKLGARNIANGVILACRAGILDGRPQRHGDHAGYEAHRRRGEDPKQCPHGCWEGEQVHKAAIRRKLLAS